MVIRAIDAISQETAFAIERAQEFFRYYMGGAEAEVRESAGSEPADDDARRDHGSDADLSPDGEAVVQAAAGGEGDAAGLSAQQGDEGVPKRSRRQRSK